MQTGLNRVVPSGTNDARLSRSCRAGCCGWPQLGKRGLLFPNLGNLHGSCWILWSTSQNQLENQFTAKQCGRSAMSIHCGAVAVSNPGTGLTKQLGTEKHAEATISSIPWVHS